MPAGLEAHNRRAENVPGLVEAEPDIGGDLVPGGEGARFEKPQGPEGIALREQRFGRLVACIAAAVGMLGVKLLDAAGIRQQDFAKIARQAGAQDRSPEPVIDEHGQVAAVIEMRVGEDDSVEARGIKRRTVPVAQTKLLVTLEQAAIDEEPGMACLDQEPGARDGSGGTEESD